MAARLWQILYFGTSFVKSKVTHITFECKMTKYEFMHTFILTNSPLQYTCSTLDLGDDNIGGKKESDV